MKVDFHTHSLASDGALPPRELLHRAQQLDLAMLAITDHDTVSGYREAADYYNRETAPLRLVPGVEFSCRWSGTTVHIVGLGMDCRHFSMREGLSALSEARRQRGKTIAERLAKVGFPGALEGACEVAGASQLGRPHFAQWMVAQGHVKDFGTAFNKYLGQGKRGDVKAFWPELATVVGWIAAAGGVAVIAHPLKYGFTQAKLGRLATEFIAAGGLAIELISGRQSESDTRRIQRLAQDCSLEISLGSDFHRDSSYGADLGVELPASTGLRGVWERWLA